MAMDLALPTLSMAVDLALHLEVLLRIAGFM